MDLARGNLTERRGGGHGRRSEGVWRWLDGGSCPRRCHGRARDSTVQRDHGPVRLGQVDPVALHRGLDSLTSGVAHIGDTDLSSLDDNDLTELRRDRVGFIFQAFNLIPTLNAHENITLPLMLADAKVTVNGSTV